MFQIKAADELVLKRDLQTKFPSKKSLYTFLTQGCKLN